MIFLGDLFCADAMSVCYTPTNIEGINNIELSGGWFNDLLVTKDTLDSFESELQKDWDFDTVLYAKFNDSTTAGNVDWDFDSVSYLLVKRKKADDFKWITIDVQKVETNKDFNMEGIDITATANYTYQYAAVPIYYGVEGYYFKSEVDVAADSLLIADKDAVWTTYITDNYLDNVSVMPNSVVETMYGRYPTIVRNTEANYEQITVNASFIPISEDNCTYSFNDDGKRIAYNKEAKMFLRNGNTKILKGCDGNIWLVYITEPPQDSADSDYRNRKITFTATEIGDPENEEDLYEAGLIPNVTSEWWNR